MRNTGQTIEVEYTNRRYGNALVNHLGGSRYLFKLDIDYSKITEEDKEKHGYQETVSNVKELLSMMSVADNNAINSWEVDSIVDGNEVDNDDDDDEAPSGA